MSKTKWRKYHFLTKGLIFLTIGILCFGVLYVSELSAKDNLAANIGAKISKFAKMDSRARRRANISFTADEQKYIKELKNYYSAKAKLIKNWPYDIHSKAFCCKCKDNIYVDALEQFDSAGFKKKFMEDNKNMRVLFLYFGMKQKMPKGMVYASGSNILRDLNKDLMWVNKHFVKIIEWRNKNKKSQKELAQNIQSFIAQSEQVRKVQKIDCIKMAIRLSDGLIDQFPDNMMFPDLKKDALKALDRSLDSIRHLITGDFHKQNLKKIVVFSKKPKLGKEDKSTIIKTIIPGKPAYVVGYFQAAIADGGGIPTLVFKETGEKNKHHKNYLPMYSNDKVKKKHYTKGHFVFNLFPDLKKVKYQSHLEYLPHLHFTKWLLMQMPGQYEFHFTWGKANPMATGIVKIDLSRENRNKLKTYYDALLKKKIELVTIPVTGRCKDSRRMVVNHAELKKYGKLLKLVFITGGGKIMFPFPRQHKVQFVTKTGYGVFEKNGKIELIHLEFRKTPGARKWKWWSVGGIPTHYELLGHDFGVKPELLNLGYEMSKKNINKCKPW